MSVPCPTTILASDALSDLEQLYDAGLSGSLIGCLRRQRKLTQQMLAALIGCSQSKLCRLEQNGRVDAETLERIQQVLEISAGDFTAVRNELKAQLKLLLGTVDCVGSRDERLLLPLCEAVAYAYFQQPIPALPGLLPLPPVEANPASAE